LPERLNLPAEWAEQSAVMLAWPHADTDWQDSLEAVEVVYTQLLAAISRYEQVLLLCPDEAHQADINIRLANAGVDTSKIIFFPVQYNDTWTRDYGPISVNLSNSPKLLNFTFNGWGNKFNAELDNTVNGQLSEAGIWSDTELLDIDFVLEGGSIESDGQGTLLTTSHCLLNPNRNPGFTKNTIENLLQEKLGCHRVLWLEHGYLAGDDTDSHIDTLARFSSTNTIVYMTCQNKDDEHYQSLKQMENELRALKTLSGQNYQLIPIEIPPAIFAADGHRLPASYVNFLIINQAVLVPVYQHPTSDKIAIKKLSLAFPDHEIIPIDCKTLILQHGSLHCVTMQLLKGVI